MGAEPRVIDPRTLAGLTAATEKPGSPVIGALGLPGKASEPMRPEPQPGRDGLSDLVLNTAAAPPSPKPNGPAA